MKTVFAIFILMSSICASAMELPHITVKDRVRLELWSLGMEKLSQNSQDQVKVQPHERVEIIKPLRDLVLEL